MRTDPTSGGVCSVLRRCLREEREITSRTTTSSRIHRWSDRVARSSRHTTITRGNAIDSRKVPPPPDPGDSTAGIKAHIGSGTSPAQDRIRAGAIHRRGRDLRPAHRYRGRGHRFPSLHADLGCRGEQRRAGSNHRGRRDRRCDHVRGHHGARRLRRYRHRDLRRDLLCDVRSMACVGGALAGSCVRSGALRGDQRHLGCAQPRQRRLRDPREPGAECGVDRPVVPRIRPRDAPHGWRRRPPASSMGRTP